ncbi:uncharacterized protein CCR75_008835 [Bremia lactucae]|uniref:Uncharacterized protein n=1 Tax=Bremia lactucae TaxID=4779 RepID=A0A976ICF1_BRELC|nr:hypothetical protein CCR75_008835 [Bremia lactucae]
MVTLLSRDYLHFCWCYKRLKKSYTIYALTRPLSVFQQLNKASRLLRMTATSLIFGQEVPRSYLRHHLQDTGKDYHKNACKSFEGNLVSFAQEIICIKNSADDQRLELARAELGRDCRHTAPGLSSDNP